jgi:flagellar biosynthesis component FlhA
MEIHAKNCKFEILACTTYFGKLPVLLLSYAAAAVVTREASESVVDTDDVIASSQKQYALAINWMR